MLRIKNKKNWKLEGKWELCLWGEGGHGIFFISMSHWELFGSFLLSWVG